MIMTETKKGYNVIATEKDGKELVKEMLRAACMIIQELGDAGGITTGDIITEITSDMKSEL